MVGVAGKTHGVGDDRGHVIPKAGYAGDVKARGLGLVTVGHVDPQVTLHLFDGVVLHVKATQIHLLVGHERWNFGALTVFVKPPAVVATFHLAAVKATVAQGHCPVGANITNSKGFTLAGAAK